MKIELKHITVKDIFDGYLNDDENNGGVVGYGELLNIRPAYQRNYVYKDKQRDKVIDTVLKGLPLNVMYWVHNEDDTYEVLDGQQRTISICDFVNGDFSVLWNGKTHYFYTLTEDVKKKILEYELTVYICEGTDSEKLDWFQTINIAGEKLLDQELRNAVYYGPWLADAKRFFSKRDCIAKRIGERYMVGDPNRQQYLETVLRWVSNDDINKYMAEHKNLPNANQLKQYFRNMVAWLNDTFEYRKEMCGVPNYATMHWMMSAQAIRDYFVTECKGVGVAHIVETETEYRKRSWQKSWARSADEIIIPSKDKLYVSTQWHAKKPTDDFYRFMDVVHRNGWGKII